MKKTQNTCFRLTNLCKMSSRDGPEANSKYLKQSSLKTLEWVTQWTRGTTSHLQETTSDFWETLPKTFLNSFKNLQLTINFQTTTAMTKSMNRKKINKLNNSLRKLKSTRKLRQEDRKRKSKTK